MKYIIVSDVQFVAKFDEYMDLIEHENKTFIITRNGKEIAMVTPYKKR